MKRATLPLLLIVAPLSFAWAAPPSKEVHQTVPLDAKGTLSIEAFKGEVTVDGWDRAEVKIDAQVVADPSCGDEKYQRERVDATEVRIERGAGSVKIVSDYDKLSDWPPNGFCSSRPFVNYKISTPATAKVRIDDHKSSIQVSNIHSDLRLQSHKGTVQIKGLEGTLHLETHKGEVHAAFSKILGTSRVQTHKGDIELTFPKGTGFQLTADLGRRGQLDSNINGTGRIARTPQYRAAVNGGGPELLLSTHRGSFKLQQL